MGAVAMGVDTRPVGVGVDEEVAGPPHGGMAPTGLAPTARAERVSTIDTLRGFALMGILIMNITDFGLGQYNYIFPLSTVKPVFHGPHWMANTVVWFLRWIFAEGKMRGMFSMLFGAGVVLLTERAEKRGAGVCVADIYLRRNMWLVLFGMLHAFFIWNGDILYFYGLSALLFLFPFRNVRPSRLMWVAGCIFLLYSVVIDAGFQTMQEVSTRKKGVEARQAYEKNHVVTLEQRKAIDAMDKDEGRFRKSPKEMYEDIHKEQAGYWSAQGARAQDVIKSELKGAYFGWGDWFGMMLLGMALYKNGFLPGRLKTKTYVLTALIGLGISWPLIALGAWHAWKSHFDLVTTNAWLMAPYDLARVTGAVGTAALLILVMRAGVMQWLMKRVAAVGQMALSNYLLTSLSMQFLFVWGPTHWFGYMEYYKLYIVMACMWAVNLTWSSLWLQRFQFGPMEWVWRSLTYWKRQPMRIAAAG